MHTLKRFFGWCLIAFGAIGVSVELDDARKHQQHDEAVGWTMAAGCLLGGYSLLRRRAPSAEERAYVPIANRVLRFARDKKGRITATEVAVELVIAYEVAHAELEKLKKSGACVVEVGAEGIYVYLFPELERESAKTDTL